MKNEVIVTGRLENWMRQDYGGGAYVYVGNLYEDVNQRWWDGVNIRTSRVKKVEDDLVYTLNSIYRLGKPAV